MLLQESAISYYVVQKVYIVYDFSIQSRGYYPDERKILGM